MSDALFHLSVPHDHNMAMHVLTPPKHVAASDMPDWEEFEPSRNLTQAARRDEFCFEGNWVPLPTQPNRHSGRTLAELIHQTPALQMQREAIRHEVPAHSLRRPQQFSRKETASAQNFPSAFPALQPAHSAMFGRVMHGDGQSLASDGYYGEGHYVQPHFQHLSLDHSVHRSLQYGEYTQQGFAPEGQVQRIQAHHVQQVQAQQVQAQQVQVQQSQVQQSQVQQSQVQQGNTLNTVQRFPSSHSYFQGQNGMPFQHDLGHYHEHIQERGVNGAPNDFQMPRHLLSQDGSHNQPMHFQSQHFVPRVQQNMQNEISPDFVTVAGQSTPTSANSGRKQKKQRRKNNKPKRSIYSANGSHQTQCPNNPHVARNFGVPSPERVAGPGPAFLAGGIPNVTVPFEGLRPPQEREIAPTGRTADRLPKSTSAELGTPEGAVDSAAGFRGVHSVNFRSSLKNGQLTRIPAMSSCSRSFGTSLSHGVSDSEDGEIRQFSWVRPNSASLSLDDAGVTRYLRASMGSVFKRRNRLSEFSNDSLLGGRLRSRDTMKPVTPQSANMSNAFCASPRRQSFSGYPRLSVSNRDAYRPRSSMVNSIGAVSLADSDLGVDVMPAENGMRKKLGLNGASTPPAFPAKKIDQSESQQPVVPGKLRSSKDIDKGWQLSLSEYYSKVYLREDEKEDMARKYKEFIAEESRQQENKLRKRQEEAKIKFPRKLHRQTLSPEETRLAEQLLGPGNAREFLSRKFNIDVTREMLSCLCNLEWLHDEVINFYMNMLLERNERQRAANEEVPKCFFWSTFFFTKLTGEDSAGNTRYNYSNVSRWTKRKKIDIFSYDQLYVPVHVQKIHWTLGMVDFRNKEFRFFDSLHGKYGYKFAEFMLEYLKDEHQARKNLPLPDEDEWHFAGAEDHVPPQENGSDCGVFVCQFAECMSDNRHFDFTQEDIPSRRLKMACQIFKGTVD